MPTPTNADIMHKLGGIESDIKHAEVSRGTIHQKIDRQQAVLDETIRQLAQVAFTLQVTTDVAVQARDMASSAREVFEQFQSAFKTEQQPAINNAALFQAEAEPVLRTIKTVRNVLVALSGLGVVSIASLGAAAVFARDILREAARQFLGI